MAMGSTENEKTGQHSAALCYSGSLPPARGAGHIMGAEPALAYRLGRSLTIAAGGAVAGALSLAMASAVIILLPYVFGGSMLQVIQALILLAGIFGAVISFSGIFVSFAEIGHKTSLEILPDGVLRFDDVEGEAEIPLANVHGVRVRQSLYGKMFGYGTIEIFEDESLDPVIVIPGIRSPQEFKAKLDLIGAAVH